MGVRTLALAMMLLLRASLASSQDAGEAMETRRITDAVSVHVGDDDSRGDTFRFEPPAGYHIKDFQIVEKSKFGDASYTAQLTSGVLSIPWKASSHTKKALGVVVDTDTASLHLDVVVKLERNPPPPAVSTPMTNPSLQVPAGSSEALVETKGTHRITAIGILCLGILVGLIAALVLFRAGSVGVKLAAAVLDLMLTGAPIAFLPAGSWVRFVYPIGLLLGVLGSRLIFARKEMGGDAAMRRTMAIIDNIGIIVILIVVFVLVIVLVE